MATHLAKVTKRMSIYAKRRVRNVLNGNYGSVFKGRGMDFDDLRVYEYGDDIKDIDWKASARSRNLMIRRYVAIRKHNIMIIADAGRNMAALAPSGETKAEVATFAAGVIAYIANRNADLVGMTFGNGAGNKRFALKEGKSHIENFLTKYEKALTLDADDANMNALLNYVLKNYRERMFLIVVTDENGAAGIRADLVRKLRARHEIMLIMVADSAITNKGLFKNEVRDVVDGAKLPAFIRKNKKLQVAEAKYRESLRVGVAQSFRRIGVMSCLLSSTDTAIQDIFRMLEEQKHVRQ